MAEPVAPETEPPAGLRHRGDDTPGLRRIGRPGHFRYVDARDRPVRREAVLSRIRALVIPPAWTEVWISPDPRSHLQATGRDARGRKQYRYHPRWIEGRREANFDRLIAFAAALPRLRRAVSRELHQRGYVAHDQVVALAVRMLDCSLIRLGDESYRVANQSFGLTTLRNRHASIRGGRVLLEFRGKSGVQQRIRVRDRELARHLRRVQELPGQVLLQFVGTDGRRHPLRSDDINAFIRSHTGGDFSAKDFRTWGGTVFAAAHLAGRPAADSATAVRKQLVEAVKVTARFLGNTPAVCRRCYIHPAVIEAYTEGRLDLPPDIAIDGEKAARPDRRLRRAETAVQRFLRRERRRAHRSKHRANS